MPTPAPHEPSHPAWLERLRQEWSADLIETHISWLLLTDDTVYKFKRPVKWSFIDYSTVELRRHWCNEEVRLGRRYADFYQGVIVEESSGEPAVVMRRFDESLRADHMCAARQLGERHVRGLVDHMLAVHAGSPAADPASPLGSPQLIGRQWRNTINELQALPSVDPAVVAELQTWLAAELGRLSPLMTRRQTQGFIREGHGDLHLANVIIWNNEAVAFDGIEFDEGLRWIDIAQELAFPYADLLRDHQPELAAILVEQWLMRTGDAEGLGLLRVHACHKALVRAMVAGMQEQTHAMNAYLTTARGIVRAGSAPRLFITHGYSGSGKSTFARQHTRADAQAATVWLRADAERKRLYGIDPATPHPAAVGQDIYTAQATDATYERLAQMSLALLQSGWSVVVDATFLDRARRDQFRDVAQAAGVPFTIVACEASPAQLRTRVADRHNDISDADLHVLEHQLRTTTPLSPDELNDVWRPPG